MLERQEALHDVHSIPPVEWFKLNTNRSGNGGNIGSPRRRAGAGRVRQRLPSPRGMVLTSAIGPVFWLAVILTCAFP
jgi:hypothetical protein